MDFLKDIALIDHLLWLGDLARAGTYVRSGSVLMELSAFAGICAPATMTSSLWIEPTIGDDLANTLGGAPCINVGPTSKLWTPSVPARNGEAFSVAGLLEAVEYVEGSGRGGALWFGDQYLLDPGGARAYGGLGQSGSGGAVWGGGVDDGSVLRHSPVSSVALSKTHPQAWALTYDGESSRLYLDGQPVAHAEAVYTRSLSDAGIGIGKNGEPAPHLRVWAPCYFGEALSPAEVTHVVTCMFRAHDERFDHFIGDSITSGGWVVPNDEAWANVCQAVLRTTYGIAQRVNNVAVSGRTSGDMLNAIKGEVLDARSGLYLDETGTIYAGANDLMVAASEVPAALRALKRNVSTMVAILKAAHIRPIVATCLQRTDFNATAAAACDEFDGWLLAGRAGTADVHDFRGMQKRGLITLGDSAHPDKASHARMANLAAMNLFRMQRNRVAA